MRKIPGRCALSHPASPLHDLAPNIVWFCLIATLWLLRVLISRMLTRGAAKAMRSPLSPRPSLVTPLANNRRASHARHHISRRLEVARQHWLSDIRYGPVPFQLSKRRQHIRAAARFKVRNCIIEAIGWYLQVLKWSDAPRNEAHCTAVHRSPGQRYTSSAPRRIP
jgi:hypothetical protein